MHKSHTEIDRILRQTLDDKKLSRSEKRALSEVFEDIIQNTDDIAWLRNQAFKLAKEHLVGRDNQLVLDWLEDIVKLFANWVEDNIKSYHAEAVFTPQSQGSTRLSELIHSVRYSLDICVFTITDNRITHAIRDRFRKGIKIRIITDDDKSYDLGSDIELLEKDGISVRTDHSQYHMHHKYAIFDKKLLLTGSYNWTRGAAEKNQENFLVVENPVLVHAYLKNFEELWSTFKE